MSKEIYTLNFSSEDIGELIETARIKKGMSTSAFADFLSIKENNLVMAEEGKGAHVFNILNKLIALGVVNDVSMRLSLNV